MLYLDRHDAGKKLAQALISYDRAPDTVIIALPRGGVVIGYEVACVLHLPLDIVCPRKIGAPYNEEFAIGAITETGEGILSKELVAELYISEDYLQNKIAEETQKAKWRLDAYRKNRPPRQLNGKRVILIDDGLATGSTMRAAIKTVRKEGAKEIVIAIPVSPPETLASLKKEVDLIVCLATPEIFFGVGQFYENFEQTTDEEVIELLASRTTTSENQN